MLGYHGPSDLLTPTAGFSAQGDPGSWTLHHDVDVCMSEADAVDGWESFRVEGVFLPKHFLRML